MGRGQIGDGGDEDTAVPAVLSPTAAIYYSSYGVQQLYSSQPPAATKAYTAAK